MTTSVPGDSSVIGWLRETAIPLRHLDAGNGFGDIHPLGRILRDARVIGLGEATHGTSEFFRLKHRLLELAVTELGVTVFAIEASHAACQPLNAWVLRGEGDRDAALVGQGYLAWTTEEFAALLDWLRAWNAEAPPGRKVSVHGADSTFNANGREAVLAFLRKVAPERVAPAEAAFRVLAEEEATWPMHLDDAGAARAREALPAIDALIGFLEDNRDTLAERSSTAELDRAVVLMSLMGHWWTGGGDARSRHMGETLARLLDREGPDTRAVFWAHNFHIGVETFPDREPTAGHVLRQRYGDAYYALALEFGEGAYQTRGVSPDGSLGDFREGSIGPPQPGSLPGELARVGREAFLVDLRAAPSAGPVASWLQAPRTEHAGTGWVHGDDPEGSYEPVIIGEQYDGIAFVGRSTPTRPLAAARRVALRGEGL